MIRGLGIGLIASSLLACAGIGTLRAETPTDSLAAESMSAERTRAFYLARAVDSWVARDFVECERWLDQIATTGADEVQARAELLRMASAGLRGEGRRVSRLVGDKVSVRAAAGGATAGVGGRLGRFAIRQRGAASLDQGDWLGADRSYAMSDSLRIAALAVVDFARTDAGADSLWRLWSGAHAGELVDPSVRWSDARDLLEQLVAAGEWASHLDASFDRDPVRVTLREVDGASHPLTAEGPAPNAAERARVASAGDSLADASHAFEDAAADLEALEAERARLSRYLARGRSRLTEERSIANAMAMRLDSLYTAALDAVDRLEQQRAAAAIRLDARVSALRGRANEHAVAYGAMQHFYLDGPAWPDPAPMGHASPRDLVTADSEVAHRLDARAQEVGKLAAIAMRESFVARLEPELEARRESIRRRIAQQQEAIASLTGRLDGHPAERALAEACSAARISRDERAAAFDARRTRLHQLRVDLASQWADQVASLLAAEAETDAYGQMAAAYGRAHEEETASSRADARSRLQAFLVEFPESVARAETRYRLAEIALAEERRRLHADGTPPDLTPALALYDSILSEDSGYLHRDAVLHQAGLLRLDSGDPALASVGAEQLERLLGEYPRSAFIQSGQLRLGIARFEEGSIDPTRIGDAAALFEAAANGPDASMGAIALYELGWCRTNQDRLLDAADAFRRLIDRHEQGLDVEARFDLRGEAQYDLVRCLARSGGAEAFRQVFSPHGPKPYDDAILTQLADVLREHALYLESAQAEALRMELAPFAPSALDAAERRIECLALGYRQADAEQARLESAEEFGPGSRWASAQTSDSLRAVGSAFARDQLVEVARTRHADARAEADSAEANPTLASSSVAAWRGSSELHERLIARWSADRDVPRWHLLAAEARAHEGAFAGARAHFREASESDTARFALEAAWQEAVVTDAWYEATRGGRERGDDARAADLLESSARYRTRAPEDPRSIDLLWRSGQVAMAQGDDESSLAAFRELAANHAADPRAPDAAELYAAILERLGRKSDAAVALESLAAHWPARAGSDRALYRAALAFREDARPREALRPLRRLTSAYPESEFSRDAWLLTAQVAGEANEIRASADAYRTLAERFPEDADSPAALLRSADLYGEAGDPEEADRMRLAYLEARPEDEETALAILEPFARRELAGGGSGAASGAASGAKLARYLELAERHPDLAANDLIAEVDFARAEASAKECESMPLSQPLAQSLEARRKSLENALAALRRTAERGVPQWTHAANVRTGELLVGLGEALEASERPSELGPEDRAAYDQVLREQAWDLYDQGEGVWSELLTRTRDEEDDPGGWLARARTRLWPRVASRFVHRPEVEFPVVMAIPPEVSR